MIDVEEVKNDVNGKLIYLILIFFIFFIVICMFFIFFYFIDLLKIWNFVYVFGIFEFFINLVFNVYLSVIVMIIF